MLPVMVIVGQVGDGGKPEEEQTPEEDEDAGKWRGIPPSKFALTGRPPCHEGGKSEPNGKRTTSRQQDRAEAGRHQTTIAPHPLPTLGTYPTSPRAPSDT